MMADESVRAGRIAALDTVAPERAASAAALVCDSAGRLGTLDTLAPARGRADQVLGTLDTMLPAGAGVDENLGTRETMASGPGEARARAWLPGPDVFGVDAAQLKGELMSELFGATASQVRIGRFTVLERLGEGGMGVVYAAYDPQLDRRVAVKVLRSVGGGDSAGARARLLREAQAMARLSHPNLIVVHEVGEHEGAVFVAMEFIKGASLDSWLKAQHEDDGPPPATRWRVVLDVFRRAGAGLAAAHASGIVHRDFKPHNVMRGEDGRVKVLDFGLARLTDAALEPADGAAEERGESALAVRLTRTGAVMGTPAYMSPEQHAGERAGERSDQFSFFAALYEGLYGQLPFAGDTLGELLLNISEGRLRPPPADAGVPAWVLRIVTRGLSAEPAERFPSMAAALDALARDPVARRRRFASAAALAVTMLGGGVGLSALARGEGPVPCEEVGAEIEEVWRPERRASAERGLVDTGSPIAAMTWERAGGMLDDYARAWAAQRVDACEQHRGGAQSDRLFDLRGACLERRRVGLDALVEIFEGADEGVVTNAVAAVAGLPGIERCGDVEALMSAVPPPDNPALAERVATRRSSLARGDAAQLAGRYDDALAVADAVAAESESIAYAPLRAEAQLARGRALQELGRAEEADGALARAQATGLSARVEDVATEAAARRVFVLGEYLSRADEAMALAEVAGAMASRDGAEPRARWLVHNNRGLVLWRKGQIPAAREELERAAEIAAADRLAIEAGISTVNLGSMAGSDGDATLAAARYDDAYRFFDGALGANHPLTMQSLLGRGQAEWEQGKSAASRATMTRLRGALAEVFGPRNHFVFVAEGQLAEAALVYRDYDVGEKLARALVAGAPEVMSYAAEAHRLLGALLVARGQPDEGLPIARAALRHAASDPERRLIHSYYLGDTLRAAGLLDEALQLHREAVAGFSEALGETSPMVALVRERLAQTLLARGELDEALAEVAKACAVFEKPSPPPPRLALALRTRGLIHARRGEPGAARASLEAALSEYARTFDADHPDVARARFALARVMSEESGDTRPASAVEQARAARDAYQSLGPGFAEERATIDAWLAGA